jgi:hypothetical protein
MTDNANPVAANDAAAGCAWCENRFKPRCRGSRQRFCSARCRTAFWSALRGFGERALASGALTIADVQNGPAKACTPGAAGERWSPISSTPGSAPPASLARFVIEIPESLLHALVFRYCELGHNRQDDVAEILGALRNIGRKPMVTTGAAGERVLSFRV